MRTHFYIKIYKLPTQTKQNFCDYASDHDKATIVIL